MSVLFFKLNFLYYFNVFILHFSSPVYLLSAVWPQSGRPLSTGDCPHLQDWQGKVSVLFCTRSVLHTVCPNALPHRCCHAVICIISYVIVYAVSCFDTCHLSSLGMLCLYAQTLKSCFVNNLLLLLLSFEVVWNRDIAKV